MPQIAIVSEQYKHDKPKRTAVGVPKVNSSDNLGVCRFVDLLLFLFFREMFPSGRWPRGHARDELEP